MAEYDYSSVLIFIDRLSKFMYFVLCVLHITALKLAKVFLATVVAKYRKLNKLISDRDLCFTSHFWHKLVLIIGCEYALYTAYHLQIDG